MRFTQSWLAVGAVVVSMVLPSGGWAESSVDYRLRRVEQILKSQVTAETMSQLDAMQQEMQELRGLLEEQQHALEKLHIRIDKRFAALEKFTNNAKKTATSNSNFNLSKDQHTKIITLEKKTYDAAYKLLESRLFDKAQTAFQDFLWQYPDGKYSPNAHYWLGEIYLTYWRETPGDNARLEKAVQVFKNLIAKHEGHHKAIDALLKLGLIEVERENWPAAEQLLKELTDKYPKSSRARIAEARLQRLKQDNHI